jgi:hypothetical protein
MTNTDTILADLKFKPTRKKQLSYRFWDLRIRPFVDMPRMSYAVNRVEGLRIETIIGGRTETVNIARKDDFIVCGPLGEKYVIKAEKFPRLYIGNVGGIVKPEQSDRLVAKYDGKQDITFNAPWGEKMLAKPGDWIVKDGQGYYRIARVAFDATYEIPV